MTSLFRTTHSQHTDSKAGSATVTILGIIMCLAIIFASIAFIVNFGMLITYDQKTKLEVKKRLLIKANEIYALLYEDPDRQFDSKFGDLAEYINGSNESVQLTDIGSALNPNMIHVELLEWLDTHLLGPTTTLFKDPKKFNAQTIIQYWEDTGLHYDLVEGYKDYFEEKTIKDYMTPYTYFNVNLTYEYVLQKLFKERTGNDSEARRFHEGITELLVGKLILSTNEMFKDWMTTKKILSISPVVNGIGLWQEDFDTMFPVLNAEPQINVHFVKEEILRALLSYEPFKIADASNKADRIIKERDDPEKKGLTKTDLQNIIVILGLPYPGFRILSYLGTMTNFWELKVKEKSGGDTYVLRWVIARIPKIKQTDKLSYKIIEEEFRLEAKAEPESEPQPSDAAEDGVEGENGPADGQPLDEAPGEIN
jgi:hypothetical protein